MGHAKETAAIARHLWNQHGRTKSSGTRLERELLHEELHAVAAPGELNHSHGQDGTFISVCPCGHSHECSALAPKGE